MEGLARDRVAWDDPFSVLTLLQQAHRLLIRQAGKKVVWLLDRFDEACRQLDGQTLNSLRSLRDQFKGHLTYVLFTRHPLARLRDPAEISEFFDIVAANTCWVGPMVERDDRWIARQMAQRLHTTFTEPEVVQLLTVTGGLPAFVKLGCLALSEGAVPPGESSQGWVERLLARPEFERSCQEIWADLAGEEQNVLSALSAGTAERQLERRVVAYLEQAGLLGRPAPDAEVRLFSPILAAFVARQRGTSAGVIELHPKTQAVLQGGVPLSIELTPSEYCLLSYLVEHPGEVCEKDSLMRAVWPEDHFVDPARDDRLAQLVKRLRDKIEPDPAHPAYIQVVRGRGYRFVQPE